MSEEYEAQVKVPELEAGKAEISMAPLIDVVFLLLIFFMVTTVFPDNKGFVIEKPESKNSESLVMKKITFEVNKQGQVGFKNRVISLQDVERLVKEQLAAAPDTAVLLKVDKNATTEVLIKAMDAVKAGGAKQVGVATDAVSRSTQ